eukprot:TRINITY_DN51855_c0_g1_i1.p1 TRINITY_DN51855_c0_g1~~TRINITY_DN51855_c0_g1_i1.p1  ORF type:complete len:553 (+),score=104.06 TRINITY_DN51855_c0_g1_i1:55-1713(+)
MSDELVVASPRSELQLAEAELRAREKEVQVRREVRRLRDTRQRLARPGKEDQKGSQDLHTLEAQLETRRQREQQLEEALRDASLSASACRPSDSKEAQACAAVWQSRIAALQDELKQKAEKVSALRTREQQLEAELRNRLHADAELLPGLRLAAAELRSALQRLPAGLLARNALQPKAVSLHIASDSRFTEDPEEASKFATGGNAEHRAASGSRSPPRSCLLRAAAPEERAEDKPLLTAAKLRAESEELTPALGGSVIQTLRHLNVMTPSSVKTLEPSISNAANSRVESPTAGSLVQPARTSQYSSKLTADASEGRQLAEQGAAAGPFTSDHASHPARSTAVHEVATLPLTGAVGRLSSEARSTTPVRVLDASLPAGVPAVRSRTPPPAAAAAGLPAQPPQARSTSAARLMGPSSTWLPGSSGQTASEAASWPWTTAAAPCAPAVSSGPFAFPTSGTLTGGWQAEHRSHQLHSTGLGYASRGSGPLMPSVSPRLSLPQATAAQRSLTPPPVSMSGRSLAPHMGMSMGALTPPPPRAAYPFVHGLPAALNAGL